MHANCAMMSMHAHDRHARLSGRTAQPSKGTHHVNRTRTLLTAAVIAGAAVLAPVGAAQAASVTTTQSCNRGPSYSSLTIDRTTVGLRVVTRLQFRSDSFRGGHVDFTPQGGPMIRLVTTRDGVWVSKSGSLYRGYPGQRYSLWLMADLIGPDMGCSIPGVL